MGHVIKGKEYRDLMEACKDTKLNNQKLSYACVSARFRAGVKVDELFDKPFRKRWKKLNINGKEYNCILDACRDTELNVHKLTYNCVSARVRAGIPVEVIFKNPANTRFKKLVIKGKEYNSVRSACFDENLNVHKLQYKTVEKRLENGLSLEDAFEKPLGYKTPRLTIKGKQYASLKEACDDLSLNVHKVKYANIVARIRKGCTIEKSFETPEKSRNK